MVGSALLIVTAYVAYSIRQAGIRRHLWHLSWLKIPAVIVAVTAAIVEEFYFRGVLMNWLHRHGIGAVYQVVASGLAFGVFHAVWGVWGGWRVVWGAVSATSALGFALAGLYLISRRHLVGCIEAHFLIDLVLEPALVIFAVEAGASDELESCRGAAA